MAGPLGYLDVGHHLLARSCDPFLALTSQVPKNLVGWMMDGSPGVVVCWERPI